MFNDYKKEVLACYLKMKNEGTLSLNLSLPTPARIREECLKIYFERNAEADVATFKLFFGVSTLNNDYAEVIRDIDIDRFKPLINLINDPEKKSDVKNVELLAWLINFNARPFGRWKPDRPSNCTDGKTTNPTVYKNKLKSALIAFVLLVFAIGTIYIGKSINPEQCMYWNGTNYIPISCDDEVINADKIALNRFLVAHQKRIMRPDTLTEMDINKKYYIKLSRDSIEFYTIAGDYPPNRQKALKKLSKYMYNKYILPKKSNKN